MEEGKQPRLQKRISLLVTVMLVLAVALCLYTAIQVLSNGYVNLGGIMMFRVVTGSMEPTIPVGALLVTKQVDISTIQVDDIICFRTQVSEIWGKIVTHRVIRVMQDAAGGILLETKGDANAVADYQYVTAENLIGKVIYRAGEDNMLSSILSFFSTKVGFLGCIVFPCLILTGVILKDCVKNIRGELKEMMEQLDEEEAQKAFREKLEAAQMTPEEYARLEEKIRAELIEELKQGA